MKVNLRSFGPIRSLCLCNLCSLRAIHLMWETALERDYDNLVDGFLYGRIPSALLGLTAFPIFFQRDTPKSYPADFPWGR